MYIFNYCISICKLYVITKLISVGALKYIRIFYCIQKFVKSLAKFYKEIKIVDLYILSSYFIFVFTEKQYKSYLYMYINLLEKFSLVQY